MQVINNRICPPHFDDGTPYPAFDVLATVGDFKGGRFRVHNGPVDIDQSPGGIIGIAGHMLQHSVGEYEGERTSFAWFEKDDVFRWAGLRQITWSSVDIVKAGLGL